MENIKLQPGDYTTREEIKAYAERKGIDLMEAYQRIRNAFMEAGADEGEDLECCHANDILECFGWLIGEGVYHLVSCISFTRHLTPEQILSASKQGDLQSEKQVDEVTPKQVGGVFKGDPDVIISTPTKEDLERDINRLSAMANEALPTAEEATIRLSQAFSNKPEPITLQPGDYTTREEIDAYAKREDIELMEAYQRICDAFVSAGAGEGEGVTYWDTTLHAYGWSGRSGVYFYSFPTDAFTRHLTPDQILTAGKQESSQPEKQVDEVTPKQVGELAVGVELATDLQATIHDYIYLLNKTYDEKARELIENQLVDLMDFEYQQLTGENENA